MPQRFQEHFPSLGSEPRSPPQPSSQTCAWTELSPLRRCRHKDETNTEKSPPKAKRPPTAELLRDPAPPQRNPGRLQPGSQLQAAGHRHAPNSQRLLQHDGEQSRLDIGVLKTQANILHAPGLSGRGRAGQALHRPRAEGNTKSRNPAASEDTTPPQVAQRSQGCQSNRRCKN